MKKVWKIVFLCLAILFWVKCLESFFYATQGPDVVIELDSRHHLMGWPGFIVQDWPGDSSDMVMLDDAESGDFCPSSISKFAVTDKYIIAEAKQGWLGINRKSLQAWGCYESIVELENEIGEKFGSLEMVDEFPRSQVYVPRRTWVTMLIGSVLYFGIVVCVLFFTRQRAGKGV